SLKILNYNLRGLGGGSKQPDVGAGG
ncbi:hypothetical protein A2U01_0078109, partial [Trifolium medium]|nr:hypothetical protein [Trifolium medium]